MKCRDVVTDWSRIRGMVTAVRGSVTKRGTSWCFVVDRGIDPATGRRRQQRRSGFRTRKEAEDALRKTIAALIDGTFVERSDQTLDEYLNGWLTTIVAAQRVKPENGPDLRGMLGSSATGPRCDPSPGVAPC